MHEYVRIHARTHACLRACVLVCVRAYVRACVHVHVCARVLVGMVVWAHVCAYARTRSHACVHGCMCTYTGAHTFASLCAWWPFFSVYLAWRATGTELAALFVRHLSAYGPACTCATEYFELYDPLLRRQKYRRLLERPAPLVATENNSDSPLIGRRLGNKSHTST